MILIVPMVLGNMRQFGGAAVLHRTWRATELAELRLIESLRSDPGLALDVQPDDTTRHRSEGWGRISPRPIDSAVRLSQYDWGPFVDAAAVEADRLMPGEP